MTERTQVYKCEICGQVLEVLNGGVHPVCCNTKMNLLEEKTQDAATEKHVPFIERVEGGILVKIGQNAAHPMTEDHFIQWIEILVDNKVCRHYLKPGDAPEAFFPVTCENVVAREYCNLHGLWKG